MSQERSAFPGNMLTVGRPEAPSGHASSRGRAPTPTGSRWGRALRAAAFLSLALLPGCAPHFIPNTDVEDTDGNRKVVEFCEEYRHAVEMRDIPKLLSLADPKYYEDGGNIDASDDMDYAGLKQYLEDRFKDTRAIRYEIRYRRIGEGRKNTILVDFTYSASYKIPSPTGEQWRRRVADNRMELVAAGDSFHILSGM